MYQRVNVIDALVLHARMFIYHASRLLSCTISIQPTCPAKTVISHAEMENRIYLSSSGFDLRFATCRATAREFGLIVISNIPTYVSKSYDRDRSTQHCDRNSNYTYACTDKHHFTNEKNSHRNWLRNIEGINQNKRYKKIKGYTRIDFPFFFNYWFSMIILSHR